MLIEQTYNRPSQRSPDIPGCDTNGADAQETKLSRKFLLVSRAIENDADANIVVCFVYRCNIFRIVKTRFLRLFLQSQ